MVTIVGLIAGMAGCGQSAYTLTIASTAGGTVTDPGEGIFTYAKGTVVNLVAQASEGYQFAHWMGDVDTIDNRYHASTTITMNGNYFITANFSYTPMVAAGAEHTVGLRSDGTVAAVGGNWSGQCNVGGWTDIIQVAAGWQHTVGLKSDGTVVALGSNDQWQCNVGGWMDIIQVAAGDAHTVGLKSDGRVAAAGNNSYGRCDVTSWSDIKRITAGYGHTVGLESDGTVIAVGYNAYGQCNVGGWANIAEVAAG
jgi:alpha-tubulin suppressor-like RCC1 family protein